MKTNVVLDDRLVEEARAVTGLSNTRELVNFALAELVRRHRKKDLTELAGQVTLREDFDHKALRELRGHSG